MRFLGQVAKLFQAIILESLVCVKCWIDKLKSIKVVIIFIILFSYLYYLSKSISLMKTNWWVTIVISFFNASFVAWMLSYLLKIRKDEKTLTIQFPGKEKILNEEKN